MKEVRSATISTLMFSALALAGCGDIAGDYEGQLHYELPLSSSGEEMVKAEGDAPAQVHIRKGDRTKYVLELTGKPFTHCTFPSDDELSSRARMSFVVRTSDCEVTDGTRKVKLVADSSAGVAELTGPNLGLSLNADRKWKSKSGVELVVTSNLSFKGKRTH